MCTKISMAAISAPKATKWILTKNSSRRRVKGSSKRRRTKRASSVMSSIFYDERRKNSDVFFVETSLLFVSKWAGCAFNFWKTKTRPL